VSLRFDAFTPAHFETLRGWFSSDSEVVRFGGPGLHYPLDDGQLQAIVDEPGRLSWMAVDEGDALVGHAELMVLHDEGAARLGRVAIAPGARGRGLGLELVSHVLGVAWSFDRVARVDLHVYPWNAPALALYRRLGFEIVHLGPETREVDGEHWEVATMSVRRSAD
jgi:ribosomal protein S18 acetylase RimI-like enzyme